MLSVWYIIKYHLWCFIVCETRNFTCLNGGTCNDSSGIPICNCPSTHYGEHCEKIPGGLDIIYLS